MLEGDPSGGEDEVLDTEGDGAECLTPAVRERNFSLPQGISVLQVSNLDVNPRLGSDRIRDQISRVFAGTGVQLIHISNGCFSLVRKPGRPGDMRLVEGALTQLAKRHPRMVVMRVA